MKRKAKNSVIYFYCNLIQHVSMNCSNPLLQPGIGNNKKYKRKWAR